jgi:8-oxo-dGTP pyrophosphatase MutT (NUDIX family)
MSAWDELKRTTALETNWFTIQKSDFELPDGTIGRGWHWIDFNAPATGVIPVREDGHLLLVHQFRFTTRTRDWEIPAGRMDEGETPEQAARRELREETGHTARVLEPLGFFHPTNGSSNQKFIFFVARGLEKIGAIQTTNEVDEARWFAETQVRAMLARNEILDGMSVTGLLWYFFALSNR